MAGAIDAQGVYIYNETDKPSPFSDLLNLGQDAQSAKFAAVAAELLALDGRLDAVEPRVADTGWVPLAIANATAAASPYAPAVRCIGEHVALRGELYNVTLNVLVATLDVPFRPVGRAAFRIARPSATTPAADTSIGLWITATGQLYFNHVQGVAATGSPGYSLTGVSWERS